MPEQTIGESRVRTTFNVGNNDVVDQIKTKSAELINLISSVEDGSVRKNPAEAGRLKSLAMTAIEEGAMWAVKAETSERAEG